ncbi:MAG: HEPN domain-containing protein [Muribaculaceae bacterium]|nr:HEPN domain-containing protein [Muribaculaceae bacterium]
MDNKVKYWCEMSDYDLETASAMLITKRYLYVGFMCHQVIEKILKAYWSKIKDEPPLKIHTLSRLANKTGLESLMSDEQLDLIDTLEPLNIEARYPTYKERLIKSLNHEKCIQLINQTKELQEWIKTKL